MKRLVRPALYLLGVNVALFLVFTLPRTLQERSLASRLARLRTEAERERGQIASLRLRAETIRANQHDATRFFGEVVRSRQATLLPALAELHHAAEAEGLELGAESFSRTDVKETGLVRLRVTLPVKGSYSQLVGFLGRLERTRGFVVVDTVGLRESGDEASLDVGVSVYFLASPEPADA
jgi:predicted metalloprotease with PDZ domain